VFVKIGFESRAKRRVCGFKASVNIGRNYCGACQSRRKILSQPNKIQVNNFDGFASNVRNDRHTLYNCTKLSAIIVYNR